MVGFWWLLSVFTVQPARWHKCPSYCVQSLCQVGIWSAENIISENIISENTISSTCIKNSDEIVIANLKTHKTAESSWADTFCVCKSTAFLAVLNKNILVKSWQVWFSDERVNRPLESIGDRSHKDQVEAGRMNKNSWFCQHQRSGNQLRSNQLDLKLSRLGHLEVQ